MAPSRRATASTSPRRDRSPRCPQGGNDTTGDGGQDTFYFDTLSTSWHTTIADFSVSNDKIELNSYSNFSQLGAATERLPANYFYAGTAATTPNQHVIYDSTPGNVHYDSDGNGPAAQIEIAHVTAGPALTAANFTIDAGLYPV